MEYVIVSLLVVIAGLILVMLLRRPPREQANEITLLRQQVDSLRSDMSERLRDTTDVLFQSLRNTTDNLNQQLANVTQQLQATTGQVGARLDNAARVIGEVQKNLGELGKATQEIKELGQSVSKLDELLRAPQLRGGLGELLLEELLKQVIPAGHYETQYRFRNGHVVDAIVRTSGGVVPIDSKFPLDNFRKMVAASTEGQKKAVYKSFVGDVKKHIDTIAARYICPDEGTFNFALMYIPSESIYYEIIIKDEAFGTDDALYSYAIARHVVPVSPNSFYAHLLVIALGLKGLQVEKSAQEIIQNLARLQGDLQRFAEDFEIVGRHLSNAKSKFDETARKLDAFGEKLKTVSTRALPEGKSG